MSRQEASSSAATITDVETGDHEMERRKKEEMDNKGKMEEDEIE